MKKSKKKIKKDKMNSTKKNFKGIRKSNVLKEGVRRERMLIILILSLIFFTLVFFVYLISPFEIFQYKKGYSLDESNLTGLEENDLKKEMGKEGYLSVENFIEVDVQTEGNFIILKDKKNLCDAILLLVDYAQIISIQEGIDSKVGFRPSNHDIIRDILEEYRIEIILMKITELRGGSYLGRLILDDGEKILDLDVRPSDGIAISVRQDKPIYVSKEVFNESKERIC